MSNVDELIAWLLKCEYIQADGGMGTCLDIPKYEVMPKEFLRFAESDLLDKTKKGKVGVLANLKRAIDCQLDIFFEILNLQNIFCGKNLKFEQKTNFIADIGMVQNKSINKLNTMRNKMEHKYVLPEGADLEIYFDLVWNVIEILSLNIQILSMNEVTMSLYTEEQEFCFSAKYDFEKRAVIFEKDSKDKQKIEFLEVHLRRKEDYDEFVRAFRVYRCLLSTQSCLGVGYWGSALEELINK